jgi:putative FmdB family regulatory protein
MPIYEYTCPDCGKDFDELQKFSDPPVSVCPTCKAGNVKKRISATSFVLKGGGWYKDHYGLKGGGGSSSEGSGSSGAGSSAPASSSTESTSASTSSSTPAATNSTSSS